MDYVALTHNEPEISTVGNLLTRRDEQLIEQDFTVDLFLSYKVDDKTNKDRIFERYVLDEAAINEQAAPADIEIKVGTTYYVPLDSLDRETLFKADTNVVETTSSKAFLAEKLAELLRDPTYTQVKQLDDGSGALKAVNSGVQVYCWLRALDPIALGEVPVPGAKNFSGPQGGWLNISAFIESMETNVDPNGGNFSISLSPILCKRDSVKGWTVEGVSGLDTGATDDTYSAQSSISSYDKYAGLTRNEFFFHTVVQENDLFYIRYERLEKDANSPGEQFVANGAQIPGKTYDMIGLTDTTSFQSSSNNNSVRITVQGRDLVKVIIDDGSYFFPLEFSGGIFQKAGSNCGKDDKLVARSKVTGELTTLNAYIERSIQFSMQFIFNQLASTGLVPNSVFAGYDPTKLSQRFRLTGQKTNKISKSTGESLSEGLQVNITKIDEVELKPTDGVWRIIKLIVDPSVRDRRIVDSSIAQEQGPLINSIKKLCQEPFVEFYTDTYGDQFNFIVRKPPFDKKSAIGLIYDDIESEGGDVSSSISSIKTAANAVNVADGNFSSGLSQLCLEIEEADVLRETLNYEQNAYSWYQITPQGLLMGLDSEMILAFIPAMKFCEYVDVWGSRPWQVVSNYIPFRTILDKNKDKKQSVIEEQAFQDLKYMIESTQYLPFTRRGTLTINGNRTYKRGTWVHYKPTNEVFYIDAVNQATSISKESTDRTTTLTVSRGMVEPFIKGKLMQVGGSIKKISYFNIINTPLPKGASILDTKFLTDWKVDRDVFNFFLQRRQWE